MDSTVTLLVDAPSLFYRALFSTPDRVSSVTASAARPGSAHAADSAAGSGS